MFKSPPEDVIREKVALELKTDKHVATTACGVDATGLQDVKVTIGEGDFGGVGTVKIEGKNLQGCPRRRRRGPHRLWKPPWRWGPGAFPRGAGVLRQASGWAFPA